mgnify:FL=1
MKRIVAIIILVCINIGYSQQYSDYYYNQKVLFENEVDTKNEIIFLGNSITEGGDWKALFPNKNVINRGISGDVSGGILFRLDEVTSSKPLKVFLLIGINDLAQGKAIDHILDLIEQIILQIIDQSKNTSIYLQSILPINPNIGDKFHQHKNNHQNIMDTNKRLKILAKKMDIKYIDLHKKMRNTKKYLKEKYTYDGLHLSEDGYEQWKMILRNYIE